MIAGGREEFHELYDKSSEVRFTRLNKASGHACAAGLVHLPARFLSGIISDAFV